MSNRESCTSPSCLGCGGGRLRLYLGITGHLRFRKEVLVSSDLNQQKRDVEKQRDERDSGSLDIRYASSGACLRIVGENEAEHGERDDHRQVRGGAWKL